MKYRITHKTVYEYSDTVPMCRNKVYLTPRSMPRQTCSYHRLVVKPTPGELRRRTDYFGNSHTYFVITEGHRRLSVTGISTVDAKPAPRPAAAESPAWEQVREKLPTLRGREQRQNYEFCFDSPYVPRRPELAEYAAVSFAPGRPIVECVADFTSRMHREFTYDPTATNVNTPVEEVFEKRRGVCQDLAHVQLACLRSLGLAARYVTRYLRTRPLNGEPRLTGADASHAWVSVYLGETGWLDVDPTNNLIVGEDHVTLAWGRDYGDVCPISGLFVGGGSHTLNVAVDVQPLEDHPVSAGGGG